MEETKLLKDILESLELKWRVSQAEIPPIGLRTSVAQ